MIERLQPGIDKRISPPDIKNKARSRLPQAVTYPPIVNPEAREAKKHKGNPARYEVFREDELKGLVEQLHSVPHESFADTMNAEMERLRLYFETIGKLYGVNLEAIARTRINQLATVMASSFFFVQNLFPEEERVVGTRAPNASSKKQEVVTFFDSRMSGGGIDFNANGGIEMAGYTAIFSVMKRKCFDDDGEFEIDYPAYSLPREVFVALQDWHEAVFPNQPFAENKLLRLGQQMMSRRVHDWIHAAILYDPKALTSTFQNWSNNSFFVEHLMDDPGMINYELLANNLHFEVWQDIFKQDPAAKDQVIGDVAEYTELVKMFSAWHKKHDKITEDEAERMGIFLSYLGVRSTFDVLRYDDPELTTVINQAPLAEKASSLLPPKTRSFLDQIYKSKQKLPFRMGSNQRLEIAEILNEYVQGLTEEARAYRYQGLITALRTDFPQKNEVPLAYEDELLPEAIKQQIGALEMSQDDPRAYKRINEFFAKISDEYGNEMAELMASLTDVDQDGYFYLKLDQNEFDFTEAAEVVHQKGAFLFQIPYGTTEDILVDLKRVNTLIATQKGSQVAAKPGDVILVNTQNPDLVEQLLNEATKDGAVDITTLLGRIKYYSEHGFAQLQDMYVYDQAKLVDTFEFPAGSVVQTETGKLELTPGYFVTKQNLRHAMQAGPISINASNQPNASRRRITTGAIVRNHGFETSGLDVFPVQEQSLGRFYNATTRKELPLLKLNDTFYERHPMPTQVANGETDIKQEVREVLQATMDEYEKINTFLIFGTRGKPPKITVEDLRKLRAEHGIKEVPAKAPFFLRVRQQLSQLFNRP